jgi:hypothetical protein
MKTLTSVLAHCLLWFATNASAVLAMLQTCRFGQSVSYHSIHIGVYRVTTTGQTFERAFPASAEWCPQSVDVY